MKSCVDRDAGIWLPAAVDHARNISALFSSNDALVSLSSSGNKLHLHVRRERLRARVHLGLDRVVIDVQMRPDRLIFGGEQGCSAAAGGQSKLSYET